MKKQITILLAAAMLLGTLTSCGGDSAAGSTGKTDIASSTVSGKKTDASSETKTKKAPELPSNVVLHATAGKEVEWDTYGDMWVNIKIPKGWCEGSAIWDGGTFEVIENTKLEEMSLYEGTGFYHQFDVAKIRGKRTDANGRVYQGNLPCGGIRQG